MSNETRELMDKIYAMTREEFNEFLAWNFARVCQEKAPTKPTTKDSK